MTAMVHPAADSLKASPEGPCPEKSSNWKVESAEVLCRTCCTPISLADRVCPFCESAPAFSVSGNNSYVKLKGVLRVLYDGRYGSADACNLIYVGTVDQNRKVVVKAARLDGDDLEVETLRQEIQIQRRLTHDHIVPLLYAAETPTEVLLLEPFASGGDLHAALGSQRMISEVQASHLCEQLLSGLRYLHEEEFILHGDVKPRNIFLVPAGHALVAQLGDFGLARECPHKAPFLCQFEGIQGSHGYIAPEILAEEAYGFGVDIFALGVMIFTLLTGYEPFYPPSNVTAPLEFDESSWEDLSKESESFVTGLLQQRLQERFNASSALAHEWFLLFGDDVPTKPSSPWSPLRKDLCFHPACKVREALASVES
ncbi:Serine/threonine-protein kinase DCLK2 (CaMK-like CREB regulatory kinase 2) (CL2) (CLICK-II) (CLICK2) (Doublecortin domain-containing protein 3B) (Doublecortin-like and CAM kinase-like 2) (Doublecortin-like kinase 2) [Durusdinium trenchii]|uniref:Protein kinase domain-containing protein n=1 Tax=Durusdinium trenchii TaxID=1381693 RepID=A0ABP0HNR5_9DINO